MKHKKKYTAKQLKAEIAKQKDIYADANIKVKQLEEEIPIGHYVYYNSNKDEMESIYFRGTKKSLRKWIKDLQKSYFPKK